MSSRDTSRPKKPQRLIDERRERIHTFINLRAPECIVADAAEVYLKSFKWSWRGWWFDWKMNLPPRFSWLLWLLDREYRELSKQCDESIPEDWTEDDSE